MSTMWVRETYDKLLGYKAADRTERQHNTAGSFNRKTEGPQNGQFQQGRCGEGESERLRDDVGSISLTGMWRTHDKL